MNQPAFPRSIYSLNGAIDSQSMSVGYGMDLRDYFAAKALQGMLAETSLKATTKEFADKSYELADAMMEARKL